MTGSSDACARLAQTRETLRVALHEIRHPVVSPLSPSLPGWAGSLLQRLQGVPGVCAVGQALDGMVRPVAQRSPVLLVVGAAALGGLLGWSRRWPPGFTPALAAAVLPRLLSGAVGGVPLQTWLTLISSLLEKRMHAAAHR